jgi:outer membrane murein-binding lipoprotein Lpp
MLLLLVTAVAVGYFVVQNRSSASGTPQDFVHTTQRIEQQARSLPVLASKVQRFTELHAFDQSANRVIAAMERDAFRLHQIASGSSGNDKAIADPAASAADQALDAAARYQHELAFTYRLNNASTAEQDLNAAVAQLKQQEQAWAHR